MDTVYRVITKGLRVQRGTGRPDLVVMRPMNGSRTVFTDSDDMPTLVSFDEHCQVDITYLLNIGAIVPWEAPLQAEKGGNDGEVGQQHVPLVP